MADAPIPKISEHGGELILIGSIAIGVLVLIGMLIVAGWKAGLPPKEILGDVSPFLLIEQSVISAIKDRWVSRLQGQSNQLLGAAVPAPDPNASSNAADAARKRDADPLDLAGTELPR